MASSIFCSVGMSSAPSVVEVELGERYAIGLGQSEMLVDCAEDRIVASFGKGLEKTSLSSVPAQANPCFWSAMTRTQRRTIRWR